MAHSYRILVKRENKRTKKKQKVKLLSWNKNRKIKGKTEKLITEMISKCTGGVVWCGMQ